MVMTFFKQINNWDDGLNLMVAKNERMKQEKF